MSRDVNAIEAGRRHLPLQFQRAVLQENRAVRGLGAERDELFGRSPRRAAVLRPDAVVAPVRALLGVRHRPVELLPLRLGRARRVVGRVQVEFGAVGDGVEPRHEKPSVGERHDAGVAVVKLRLADRARRAPRLAAVRRLHHLHLAPRADVRLAVAGENGHERTVLRLGDCGPRAHPPLFGRDDFRPEDFGRLGRARRQGNGRQQQKKTSHGRDLSGR